MSYTIHQTWKTSQVPDRLVGCQQSWRTQNPNAEYKLWTDLDMDAFVKEHHGYFYDRWKDYPHSIQRVDSFRYMLMYTFGGAYADLDMQCIKSIQPLVNNSMQNDVVILGEENQQHSDGTMRAGNAIMISAKPGHPFWAEVIVALQEEYHKSTRSPSSVFVTTGPSFLHDVYRRHPAGVQVLPSDAFYPKQWHEPTDVITLATPKQYPKSYTVHHWAGTWRKNWPQTNVELDGETFKMLTPFKAVGIIDQAHTNGKVYREKAMRLMREASQVMPNGSMAVLVGGYVGHVAVPLHRWLNRGSFLMVYEPYEAHRAILEDALRTNLTSSHCEYTVSGLMPWSALTTVYAKNRVDPKKPQRIVWRAGKPQVFPSAQPMPAIPQAQTCTVDQLSPSQVGMLVIEACGEELEVLAGASGVLQHQLPIVFIHLLPDEARKGYGSNVTFEDVRRALDSVGYSLEEIDLNYYLATPR